MESERVRHDCVLAPCVAVDSGAEQGAQERAWLCGWTRLTFEIDKVPDKAKGDGWAEQL